MFKQATILDERYASAYVGLGWTDQMAVGHGWSEFPSQALERIHDLAQKALSIEESSAGHRLLGYVYLIWAEYDQAFEEVSRAIDINPNDWDSHAIMGTVMLYAGKPLKAIEKFEVTLRFNPNMDPDRLFELGLAYYMVGRYSDAIRILEQNLDRHPDHAVSHIPLSAAYAKADRLDEATQEVKIVRRHHPFFEVASFGSRFSRAEDQKNIAAGLYKAGLN